MIAQTERDYLQRRAQQELGMTMRADCIEAERAHSAMTDLYLERCIGCCEAASVECEACPLRRACATIGAVSHAPA